MMDPVPKFRGIIADPPWQFVVRSGKGMAKSAENHYDCMTLDEIKRLPVKDFAAEHCMLWLWTTGPFLRHSMDVLDAWGFTYKTSGHWNKITKFGKPAFGTGYWLRGASEPFLIATRGSPKLYSRSERSCFDGPLREHSQKPVEAIQQFCRMTIRPRLELFSREDHPGIDAVWGHQTGKFGGGGGPVRIDFPMTLPGNEFTDLSAGQRQNETAENAENQHSDAGVVRSQVVAEANPEGGDHSSH